MGWRYLKTRYSFINNNYKVSDNGVVKSLSKYHYKYRKGTLIKYFHKGRLLKPCVDTDGYKRVRLSSPHFKSCRKVLVHRLVAEAFIPNPHHYPIVNHKDENRLNDNVYNLEWCSRRYNIHYGNCMLKNELSDVIHNRDKINFRMLDAHDQQKVYNILYLIEHMNCIYE